MVASIKEALHLVLLTFMIYGIHSTTARSIPSVGAIQSSYKRSDASSFEIKGLEALIEYVCVPCTDVNRRDTTVSVNLDGTTIAADDVNGLISEISALKEQVIQQMQVKGVPIPSNIAKRATSVLGSYVCPICTNVSFKRGTFYSITTNLFLNVPAADLPLLLSQLENILKQLNALVQSEINSIIAPSSLFPVYQTNSLNVLPSPPSNTGSTGQSGGFSVSANIVYSSTTLSAATTTLTLGTTTEIYYTTTTVTPTVVTGVCSTSMTLQRTIVVTAGTSPAQSTSLDSLPPASASSVSPTTTESNPLAATTSVPQSTASTSSVSTTGYTFNSQSSKNIAVYFGQTVATGGTSLLAQCADPNIDIVILAFIIAMDYNGGKYPQVNFGSACGGQTTQMASEAPGLLSCPLLASNISSCQQTYGKKVLLSIGGATAGIIFPSSESATDFGNILWQLFGPVGNIDTNLRPFGEVVIDGFDVDNEDNNPSYYNTLGTTLRNNYATDMSKDYYLSSAPQCPFPDASNPISLLLQCDFVWVQFYNNPPCEIGSSGFADSMRTWSNALNNSTLSPKPRLYLGAPAWSAAGPTAYAHIASAEGMEAVVEQAEALDLDDFGGVMFWDGPEGMLNIDGGKDIIAWAKAGLD